MKMRVLSLALVILLSGCNYGSGPTGAARSGLVMTSNYASLAAADAAALDSRNQLVIDSAVSADASTILSPVRILAGGSIIVNSGAKLTFQNSFEAGLVPVFAGGGEIVFGPGSVVSVVPQWWGATGTASDSDSAAIQAALKSAVNSSVELYIPEGRYKITANLVLPSVSPNQQVIVRGAGINTKLIAHKSSGVTKVFELGQSADQTTQYASISDLMISGNGDGASDPSAYVAYGIHAPFLTHSQFRNLWIFSFGTAGFLVENGWSNFFENLQIMYSTVGFIGKSAFNQNEFSHCKFWLNQVGVYLGSGLGNLFANCLFESNAKTGVFVRSTAAAFEACYFEGNAKVSASGFWPPGMTSGVSVTHPAMTIKADMILDGGSTLAPSGLPTAIETLAIFAPSSGISIDACSTAVYGSAAESFIYVIGADGLEIRNTFNTTTSIPMVKAHQSSIYSRLSRFSAADNVGFSANLKFHNSSDGSRSYYVTPESIRFKSADQSNYAETDFMRWISGGPVVGTFTRKNVTDRYGRSVPVWALNYASTAGSEIRGFTMNPAEYPQNAGKLFAFMVDIRAETPGTSVKLYGKTSAEGAFPVTTSWATYTVFFTWPESGGPFFMGGLSKSGNAGAVYVANPVLMELGSDYQAQISRFGRVREFYGTVTPSAGDWLVGDRIINSAPVAGFPKSWVCTASGTPGTWVSEGNL